MDYKTLEFMYERKSKLVDELREQNAEFEKFNNAIGEQLVKCQNELESARHALKTMRDIIREELE